MPLILLIVLFASCAEPLCETPCHMEYYGPMHGAAQWSCDAFEGAEAKALRLFEGVTDPRFEHACRLLGGVAVRNHPTSAWIGATGTEVAGQSFCVSRSIEVGAGAVARTSLMHEMAHLIQGCIPVPDGHWTDYHDGWDRNGIYDALNRWHTE